MEEIKNLLDDLLNCKAATTRKIEAQDPFLQW